MSTATDNQQPPNSSSSSLRGVVARHPVTSFLIMAFVIGWGGMLPLLLSESGPVTVVPIELPWQPFVAILSIFGLALPAFLVTAATGGKEGVRELLGRLERNGVPGPVVGQLRKRLPEGEYRGPQDVLSALRRGR